MTKSRITLIGRKQEQATLRKTLESAEAEFVAVYGRRRVGKTFLVREFFRDQICFDLTGAYQASMSDQLANFGTALAAAPGNPDRPVAPESWREAFQQLAEYLRQTKSGGKRVIFLDELPWLATRRSGLLPALEHFWNAWASRQRDIVLVVCGSATSWMIHKLLHHRGGLHNRVTRRIRLEPFTLAETREFLESRRVKLSDRQVLELYMVMGGVPQYLKSVEPGRSAAQNIDAICFAKSGELRDEFDKLYSSLFEHAERHVAVIRALAKKRRGLTRNELLAVAGRQSGGGTTDLLAELTESGFVQSTVPLGKSHKDALFRLVDEYSLFYLNWIEPHRSGGKDVWLKKQAGPAWRAWSGYAFENICLKHTAQIKSALGIAAVETSEAAWFYRPANKSESGTQIDLLIDRKDGCINICEMKFSEGEFVIDKRYAAELRTKADVFRRVTENQKTIFLTMVTTSGVKKNDYYNELVSGSIEMDALFA